MLCSMTPKYPRINPDRDRIRNFYLDEDVIVTLTDGNQCLIPKGYRFDGPSIPFPLPCFVPKFSMDIYPALVHDYLIDTRMFHLYSRKFIDCQYEAYMHIYPVGKVKRVVYPLAVHTWRYRWWILFIILLYGVV